MREALAWWEADPGDLPLVDQTVGALLDDAAMRGPDHEAVAVSAFGDVGCYVRWSYTELRQRADALARGLMAVGVERGDRVAIWAPNVAEWLVVEFAVAKVGGVLVTVNPTYRSEEVEFVLS